MRRVKFYILAIAAVCAVACAEETKKSSNLPVFETFEYNVIEEDNYSFTISYEHITNTADSEALAIIEEQNYQATFGEYALEEQDLQHSAEILIEDALTSMEMYNIDGDYCSMNLYQVASIIRNDSIVCYDTFIETYSGSAHPNILHMYECYDLAAGNAYDFSYLLDGEWYEALVTKIYEKLDAEHGDHIFASSVYDIHIPRTIYLTDSGIVFLYQPYEIAAYAYGSIAVELTDAELEATGAPIVWK